MTNTPIQETILNLSERARRMRKHVIRMTTAAGSGHPAPSFSIVDIVAALYFSEMKLDPAHPDWQDRDLFVLSKGHAAPALYAALREVNGHAARISLLRQCLQGLLGPLQRRLVFFLHTFATFSCRLTGHLES